MKRPLGVTVLALVYIGSGAFRAWTGLLAVRSAFPLGASTISNAPLWLALLPGLGGLALGTIFTLIGIGLWRLRQWARGAFIGLTAVGCLVPVAYFALNQLGAEIWMPANWFVLLLLAFGGLSIWYMLLKGIKEAFHSREARP